MKSWFELWDFADPAKTEAAFRSLEPVYAKLGSDKLAELRTQISRTHSLRRQFEEAHAILDEVANTPTLEPRTRVYLHLERGRSYNSAGEIELARSEFVRARELAHERRIDDLEVDALHMLGITDKGEASLEWNRLAINLAGSSSDPRARRWLASLLNNMGWSLHDLGRYDEALAAFERAVPLRLEQGDVKPLHVAKWAVARCKRSLGRFEEAFEEQLLLRQDDPDDGYVHEEIAENLVAMDRHDEASVHFGEAFRLLSQDAWLAQSEPDRLKRLQTLGEGTK